MQMIVTFIILIAGAISFLVTYKTTIIEPIESVKKLCINSYLTIIVVLLTSTSVINFYSRNENSLLKRLVIVLVISIGIMLVFFGVKINLDKTYTKDKFGQYYTEQNVSASSNNKSKIDIGMTGIGLKTEKEYYIDECLEAYSIFCTKFYVTMGINLLLNILLIYQIVRIYKIQLKKEKLNKDDLILFDEKQNVKL